MMQIPKSHVTLREAARLMGVSDTTIYRYAKGGRFPGLVRIGKFFYIPIEDVPVVHPDALKQEEEA